MVVGALAIAVLWHETRAAQAADAGLAALNHRNDELAARLREDQAGARAGARDAADLARALAGLRPEAGAAGEGPTDPARAAARRAAGTAYLRTGARMDLLAQDKFLKLSPDEIDALADIEARTRNTVVNGVVVPGNPPEAARAGRREIVALLGLDRALELGAEARVLPYRKMTADLAGILNAGEPLAASAASQLTSILAENRVDTEPAGWPAALAAARAVLSPAQAGVLQTYATSRTGIDYSREGAP